MKKDQNEINKLITMVMINLSLVGIGLFALIIMNGEISELKEDQLISIDNYTQHLGQYYNSGYQQGVNDLALRVQQDVVNGLNTKGYWSIEVPVSDTEKTVINLGLVNLNENGGE